LAGGLCHTYFEISDTPYHWIFFGTWQDPIRTKINRASVIVINFIQPARRSERSQNAQTRLMLRRFALSRTGRFFILKANRADFPGAKWLCSNCAKDGPADQCFLKDQIVPEPDRNSQITHSKLSMLLYGTRRLR
jgi:hypothetical protein